MPYHPINGDANLLTQDETLNASFDELCGWFASPTEPDSTKRRPFMKWVDTDGAGTPVYVRDSTNTKWLLWLYLSAGKGFVACDDNDRPIVLRTPATGVQVGGYTIRLPSSQGTSGQVLSIASVASSELTMQWVTVAGGVTSLDTLSDVTITTPTTGQVLVKSAGDWINQAFDHSVNVTGLTISNQGELRLAETGSAQSIRLRAAAIMPADYTLTLPANAPAANNILQSDASGVLSWIATPSGGGGSITVEENLSSVVTGATILNFGAGIDVTNPGGGRATMVVDPSEVDHNALLNYVAAQHTDRTLAASITGLWEFRRSNSSTEFIQYSNDGSGVLGVAVDGDYRYTRGAFTATLAVPATLTASRTFTLPDVASGELTIAGNVFSGTGALIRQTSPTVITPTIANFSGAAHSHADAAGGGQLNASNVFAAGELPVSRGGTGIATIPNGSLLLGAGTSPVTALAPGSNGTFLAVSGGVPSYRTLLAGDIPPLAYISTTGGSMSGVLTLTNLGEIRLSETLPGADYVALRAQSALGQTYTLQFPATAPTAGQILEVASIAASVATLQWIATPSGGGSGNAWTTITAPTGGPLLAGTTDTLALSAGAGLSIVAAAGSPDTLTMSVVPGSIDHDALLGFVSTEHTDRTLAASITGLWEFRRNAGTNDEILFFNDGAGILGIALDGNVRFERGTNDGILDVAALSAARTWTLPNQSGTITALGNATTGTGNIVLSTAPSIANAILATSVNVTGPLVLDNQQPIRFSEATGLGGDYVGVRAASPMSASYTLTLPSASPGSATFLQSDATGAMSWIGSSGTSTVAMTASPVFTGSVTLDNQGDVRLRETTASGTNYVGLRAAATMGSDYTIQLPAAAPVAGQVLEVASVASGIATTQWITTPAGGSGNSYTTIQGDSGSATAGSNDTLSFVGGVGVSTVVAAGTPDTVTFNYVASEIDHDSLLNFVAAEHTDRTSAATISGLWEFRRNTGTADQIVLANDGAGTLSLSVDGDVILDRGANDAVITAAALTSTRTFTLPDQSGTVTALGNATSGSGNFVLHVAPQLQGTITCLGPVYLDNQQELRLGEGDAGGSLYIALRAPADITAASSYTLTMPAAAVGGSAGTELLGFAPNGDASWLPVTGAGSVVLASSPTITTPTITTPTIATFTNAQHSHQSAAGGGQLDAGSVFSTGAVPAARGGTGLSSLTANNILAGAGTSPAALIPPGAGGTYLRSSGTGSLPTFSALLAGDIPSLSYLPLAGGVLTGALTMDNQQELRLRETTAGGTNYVGLRGAATMSANYTLTMPSAAPAAANFLESDGGGSLSWIGSTGTGSIVRTSVPVISGATFTGNIAIDSPFVVRFKEQPAAGAQFVDVMGPVSLATSYTLTLPSGTPVASNALISDGSGQLSFGDHGNIAGLADDDHTQYMRVDGVRLFSDHAGIGNQKHWQLYELTVNGLNYVGWRASASMANSYIIEMPSGIPTNGQVLIAGTFDSGTGVVPMTWGAAGGSSDHGALTGLGDDDHTQYSLASGARDFTGHIAIDNQQQLRLREADANGSNYVGLRAPAAITTDYTLELPAAAPVTGQYLHCPTPSSGISATSWADTKFDKSFAMMDPKVRGLFPCWRAPYTCTVTAIYARRSGSVTACTVSASKNTTSLLQSNIAAGTTWTSGTLTGTASVLDFAAGDTLQLQVHSVSGTSGEVAWHVDFKKTGT
jgi:hypothetical protein